MTQTIPTPVSNPTLDSIKTAFERDGFYHARALFDPSEVARLETDFDRIVHQLQGSGENVNARWTGAPMEKLNANGTTVIHTHNVQQYSARWAQALLHNRFLDCAEAILGPDIVLHHTKLFMKPPETGAPFPMHQDWEYFPTLKDSMIAGIVHVSRATDAMGCLRVYPGSHRLGRIPNAHGQLDSDLLAQYPLERATPLEAEPGDVVFFHYFTLHGSLPNTSGECRKTVLVQLHAGDDQVEPTNKHPNERWTLRGWNHCATRNRANASKS